LVNDDLIVYDKIIVLMNMVIFLLPAREFLLTFPSANRRTLVLQQKISRFILFGFKAPSGQCHLVRKLCLPCKGTLFIEMEAKIAKDSVGVTC
jgi:hypothetical protein